MAADRAFVVAVAILLVTMLCGKAYPAIRDLRPKSRLNVSVPPFGNMRGPTYLTSNLPLVRRGDDVIPDVSLGRGEATSTGALAA